MLSLGDFVKWYTELGKLKIFFAKPVREVKVVEEGDGAAVLEVSWVVRGRAEKAVLAVVERADRRAVGELVKRLGGYNATKILMAPEDAPVDLGAIDARGVVYWWRVPAATLEPNREVRVAVFDAWGEEEVAAFREVHRGSWGFFIPPRPRDHLVVVAFLGGEPVGMAYLNVNNFNIDYGVHVVKQHWRKRIGTRILAEALRLAEERGADAASVVRVFRSVKGRADDIRAVKFYRANNPAARMAVYRIR